MHAYEEIIDRKKSGSIKGLSFKDDGAIFFIIIRVYFSNSIIKDFVKLLQNIFLHFILKMYKAHEWWMLNVVSIYFCLWDLKKLHFPNGILLCSSQCKLGQFWFLAKASTFMQMRDNLLICLLIYILVKWSPPFTNSFFYFYRASFGTQIPLIMSSVSSKANHRYVFLAFYSLFWPTFTFLAKLPYAFLRD